MIMATPPKYGTDFLWDLWGEFGLSTKFRAIAILRIKGVKNPTKTKLLKKRMKYSWLVIPIIFKQIQICGDAFLEPRQIADYFPFF